MMSDLDKLIGIWRAPLDPRLGTKAVDELEDHLRTIVESLSATGLPEHERLLVAIHRLGQPTYLASEFEKIGSSGIWRERVGWFLVGLVPGYVLYQSSQMFGAVMGSILLQPDASRWEATSLYLIPKLFLFGILLGAVLIAGKGAFPVTWSIRSWLPVAHPRRTVLFGAIVLALLAFPYIASSALLSSKRFIAVGGAPYGGKVVAVRRVQEPVGAIYATGMRDYVETVGNTALPEALIYSLITGGLIAWLVTSPGAGAECRAEKTKREAVLAD